MTQVDLRGCSVLDGLGVRDDSESLDLTLSAGLAESFSWAWLACNASEFAVGVLGVLFEEPNEANAPDPSPNAEEAPTVGDATLEF